MHCIFDEPNKPYYCTADWSCAECPNFVDDETYKEYSSNNEPLEDIKEGKNNG